MKDKKTQIIEAAITLFANQGLSVTTAKIAQTAEVSNGTLFNHFTNKQVLLDNVYLSIKHDIAASTLNGINDDICVHDMIRHFWHQYTQWAMLNPLSQKTSVLLRSSGMISEATTQKADLLMYILHEKLDTAKQSGIIKNIPTPFLNKLASMNLLATIAYAHDLQLKQQDLLNHIENSYKIFWDGIKK